MPRTLPRVVADGAQLQQVFMNLILNAAEAMDGRGTLTLRACRGPRPRTSSSSRSPTRATASRRRTRPRLFEPFFTTKEVGKGTGLGLAISYGIVRKHQGTIEVRSEAGRGAMFTVRLPLQRKAP